VVTTNSVVVGFIRNGNSGDTTCALPNDTNRIIVSAIDLSGAIVSDSVTILKIPNYHSPVLLLYNPSKDTVVYTNSITIHYRIDTASHDSIVSLNEGFNNVGVSITDAMGKVISASVMVLYKMPNTCYAFARAPQTAFTYQTIYLDGRVTQNLLGFPTKYKWRQIQISGDYVCIYDSTAVITPVLTRGYGTLKFEMEVRDEAGTLAPAYDTVTVTVAEPQNIFDFTNLLTYNKYGADNGPQITVTSPGMEASYYTNSDTMTLSGTALGNTATDTVWWYVIPGTANGRFVPQGNDWSGLKVPVSTGDNLITLVYTDDSWAHVAVDRLHVSKGKDLNFGEISISPVTFWIDSLMTFHVTMQVTGANGSSVGLQQILKNGPLDFGQMYDNGDNPRGDAIANDNIYSKFFTLRPQKDSVYYFYVSAVNTAGSQFSHSAVYTFTPQVPYSGSLADIISNVNSQAASQYSNLKTTLGQNSAMDSIVNWLNSQPSVTMAGVGPGGKALCWEFDCGVHAMITDAPENTKGGGVYKNRTKGLAPYMWRFLYSDDCWQGNAYSQFKLDTALFNIDSVLADTANINEYKGLEKYRAVIISTHGNTFGYKDKNQIRRFPSFDSVGNRIVSKWGKPFQEIQTNKTWVKTDSFYWGDMNSSKIYPRIVLVKSGINLVDPTDTLYDFALTPSFFSQYTKQMQNSLIYLSCCRSLYDSVADYGSFWNVFHRKGAAAMLGYTDYTDTGFSRKMGQIIFNRLAQGDTLKHAFDSTVAYCRQIMSGNFWVHSDSLPSDSSSDLYASRFKFEGDSNFVFNGPFYLVDLKDRDSLHSSGYECVKTTNCTNLDNIVMPPLKAFYPTIPLDTAIFVKNSKGNSVPFLQTDLVLWKHPADTNTINFNLTTNAIHARNIFMSINTDLVPNSLKDSTVGIITSYFHKGGINVMSDKLLKMYQNIRNIFTGDTQSCFFGQYFPSDTSNWSNITEINLGGSRAGYSEERYVLDMIKIGLPDSLHTYNLDSIKIKAPDIHGDCPPAQYYNAGLKIQAITIEQ
jgi:hypothetical protein